jgi:hypothetical protein
MKNLAPDILRKRMLLEGFFTIDVSEEKLVKFFEYLTSNLNLKTYGDPIIHATSGVGKDANQGYDAFVPLIDSGIYIAVWSNQKFLSAVIYTCKEFDEQIAIQSTKEFFRMTEVEFKMF